MYMQTWLRGFGPVRCLCGLSGGEMMHASTAMVMMVMVRAQLGGAQGMLIIVRTLGVVPDLDV